MNELLSSRALEVCEDCETVLGSAPVNRLMQSGINQNINVCTHTLNFLLTADAMQKVSPASAWTLLNVSLPPSFLHLFLCYL